MKSIITPEFDVQLFKLHALIKIIKIFVRMNVIKIFLG